MKKFPFTHYYSQICPHCGTPIIHNSPEKLPATGRRIFSWGLIFFFVIFTLPILAEIIGGKFDYSNAKNWMCFIFSVVSAVAFIFVKRSQKRFESVPHFTVSCGKCKKTWRYE